MFSPKVVSHCTVIDESVSHCTVMGDEDTAQREHGPLATSGHCIDYATNLSRGFIIFTIFICLKHILVHILNQMSAGNFWALH